MAVAAAPSRPSAYVSEVVVQGVRRFGDVRRFALLPGYNVLYGLSAAGKSTLHDVLLSLLFARPPEGEAESFKSLLPQGQAACRAGMSINLGGETWRVLKDYQQNAVTLSRYITAEKRFDLVYSQPAQIVRWLGETAGLPAGPSFGRLFTMTRQDFPSLSAPITVVAPRRDGVSSDTTLFEERLRAMSLPEKKQMLVTLTEEYRRHAEVKTSEFLQDGMRTKLYEVESLIKQRDDAREKIKEIDLELKDVVKLPKLPDGIDERIEAYKRHEKTREAELEHLLPRQQDAHAQLDAVIPSPFTEKDMRRLKEPLDIGIELLKRDRQLDAGLGAMVIGLPMILFGSTVGLVGMILTAVGIGLIAYRGLLVFLKGKERFDALVKVVDAVDEQVKLVERKWDIETTVVRNLMKAYGADDPREMKEVEKNRDGLVAKKSALEATIADLALPNGEKNLDLQQQRIQRQIANVDERLQELSGKFTTDPKDLEPQIERLDREVARAEGRKATPRSKLFGLDDADADAGDDDGDSRNAIVTTVDAWCGSRRADMGRVLRTVQEAYGKNLKALSGGKLHEAAFDQTGSVSVRENGRPPLPFESLDPMGKDAAWLSLRMTFFQLESRGARRMLALLDDPFEFEEGRLQAISRALKSLGPSAQVIHLTSRPIHQRHADHQLEI